MFRFESVAAGYFLLIVIGAARAPVRSRRAARGAATAAAGAILVAVASRTLSDDARLWLGHLYLVLGYWIPSVLTAFTGETRFEAWLRRHDMTWRTYVRPPSPMAAVILELAYLACYVVVPAGFVTVWTYAARDEVDRFWVAVLVAGFACYVTLPWLVSRPPRMFDEHPTPSLDDARDAVSESRGARRGVASFNASVLRTVSHQFNTFPSGHVAVATAVALTVLPVSIGAGALFGIIALGIALGAAAGRYHYGIDVLAGALVGVAAAIVA